MDAELQTQVAFHLTGKRPGAGLEAVDPLDLRPALLARYRDLSRLRYDFPLVMVQDGSGQTNVQALSGVIDGILHAIAHDDDGERVTHHVLRLEREIRALLSDGATGSLATLWDAAAGRVGPRSDEALQTSLARARAALRIDGDVVDCDAAMPGKVIEHAWRAVQQQKARRFGDFVSGLCLELSNILRADFVRSEAGRSPENLKASIGGLHADEFDFGAMSRLLRKTAPNGALPETRRRRIQWLLTVLESQRFFPAPDAQRGNAQPLAFAFASCTAALTAYRERLPRINEFAKAVAIAELEIAGEYKDSRHDAYFEDFGADGLDPKDLALFPDYLVRVNAATLDAVQNTTLMEILSAELPMKLLVQTDDILDASQVGDGVPGFLTRSRQLANMTIGLNEVFVLQSSASNLFQLRNKILAGLDYPGPSLFSVFSGAGAGTGDLPPYLVAAAAMESRAFPAFVYDPSAGPDLASRFDLGANAQVERDWPVHDFAYEDEAHQRVSEEIAFTLVDFAACDRRCARHFARVPPANWTGTMVSVADGLARAARGLPENVPCLLMVDNDNALQKVIVDDKLMREARRCRNMWHSLQEQGGIHNSHAERLLSRESKAREERERDAAKERVDEPKPAAAAQASSGPAAAPVSVEAAPEKPSDDAYIETARCTTCNECTNINDKMFAYNENKQAHIANADAGTYAQLIEAAESCQVAIIHPGKPRNADEPGLEELMKRAEAFR